jgi:hypothetical protein
VPATGYLLSIILSGDDGVRSAYHQAHIYGGRGTGKHMLGGVKFQGWQMFLAKLILKMMNLMKKNIIKKRK